MLNNGRVGVVTNEVLKKAYTEMDHYAETGDKYCPQDMIFCTTYAIFAEICLNKKYGIRRFSLQFSFSPIFFHPRFSAKSINIRKYWPLVAYVRRENSSNFSPLLIIFKRKFFSFFFNHVHLPGRKPSQSVIQLRGLDGTKCQKVKDDCFADSTSTIPI